MKPLAALWLLLFAGEAWRLAHYAGELSAAAESLEARGADSRRDAGSLIEARRRQDAANRDLGFLQDLPNLLPDDKGYLRTQKALAGEVRDLRQSVSGKLPPGLYVLVDAKANKLYLKNGLKLLWQADCSVGRGGVLLDSKTGRRWEFVTPRGAFKVLTKIDHPKWKKPDWAYVEAGEKTIPAADDPARLVEGELGAFVLNLGDGYLIHGVKNETRLGQPASHGCVRLGAADLKKLYDTVPVGTPVYIFY